MAETFATCPSCARHIRTSEAACPFCGASTPAGFAEVGRSPKAARGAVTRAALLFAGAAVGFACSSSETTGGGTADASPAEDAAGDVKTDGGPVAMYGPAPVDSGMDQSNGQDSGQDSGPVAAYGPAPVDSGQG
jgi:hypothetical protein